MKIVVGLLWIAAIFQVSDHSQILSSGVLRGMDDVKIPAFIMFTSHWLLGVPFGIYLAFFCGVGTAGVWWGLSVGLIMAASLLGSRAWKMTSVSNLR